MFLSGLFIHQMRAAQVQQYHVKTRIIKSDNDFQMVSTVKLNTVSPDVIISLLNEIMIPVMVWKAHNAFPVKVDGQTQSFRQ